MWRDRVDQSTTTQHKICIEPTAAVESNTAANRNRAGHMADPDQKAAEVSLAADGDRTALQRIYQPLVMAIAILLLWKTWATMRAFQWM